MIELVFVTCLLAAPQDCDERRLTFLPEYGDMAGIMGCMVAAQPRLAKWTETHPGNRIEHWTCRHIVRGEAKI